MAAPQNVDEYRTQFPNASPCLHSQPSSPPCTPCVENRITAANAVRAGVHLGQTPPSPEVVAHAAAQAELEPAPLAEAEPIPAEAPVAQPEEHTEPPPAAAPAAPPDMVVTHEVLGPELQESFLPGVSAAPAPEVDPLTPGFSYTPPPALGTTVGPHPLGVDIPLEEAGDPDEAEPANPLALEPDQVARRAAIEAGTHPAVAPVLTSPELGAAAEQLEAAVAAIPPPPEPTVEERQPAKTYASIQRNSAGTLYGWDGTAWELVDEDAWVVVINPDGSGGVFAKGSPVGPMLDQVLETDEDRQAAIEAKLAQSYIDQAEAAAEEAAAAQQPAPVAPSAPPTPEAAPAPTEPVSVPVAALDAVAQCAHGMPVTDTATGRSAACGECLTNSDGAPPAGTPLVAMRFQEAQHESLCARAVCGNTIQPGDFIGYVDGVGWCCSPCTKPRRPS